MRRLILATICAATLGQAALAQTIDERIATSLQAEGYQIVTMSRTWLGRIYVIAETDTVRREMVFNPATGEVLRDYAVTKRPVVATADNGSDSERTQSTTVVRSDDTSGSTAVMTDQGDAALGETATITLDPDVPSVVVVDPVIVPPSD